MNIFVALNRLRFPLALPSEHLGRQTKLPPWLEPARAEIEQVLPPQHLPADLGI